MICFIFGVTTAILTAIFPEELFLLNALLQTFSFQVKSVDTREYRHAAEHSHSLQQTHREEKLHCTLGTIWKQYETAFETKRKKYK